MRCAVGDESCTPWIGVKGVVSQDDVDAGTMAIYQRYLGWYDGSHPCRMMTIAGRGGDCGISG
jgi:alkyl sulfatase BDS1-like metallo-beta-lactamase superfamily hydrolase